MQCLPPKYLWIFYLFFLFEHASLWIASIHLSVHLHHLHVTLTPSPSQHARTIVVSLLPSHPHTSSSILQIHCLSDERLERNVLNVCVHVEHQVIHEMQHTAKELDFFRLEISFSKLIQDRSVLGE